MVNANSPNRRWPLIVARIAGSLTALAVALLGSALALFVDLMRCDEGCSDPPTSWHVDADAWQWDAQFAVAGVAALCTLGAGVAIARGRWRGAAQAGTAAVVAWAIWYAWASSS